MIKFDFLHRKWMKQPGYRKAYEALEEEFALNATLAKPSTRTLSLFAKAAGDKRKTVMSRRASGA